MHDSVLNPAWDTLLIAVPFVGVLLFGMFRLDAIFASPRQAARTRRPRRVPTSRDECS